MQVRPGTLTLLLVALALFVVLNCATAGQPHRIRRVRVRTACQGGKLTLSCHRGYRVHVLAAFYGRGSRRICPSVLGHRRHKRLHNRACAAKGALDLVRRECKNRPSCRLRALSSVFGNPCHHQRKYLRVRYVCKFRECKRLLKLQAKLLRLAARYGKLAKSSYGYWRRRHYLHRRRRLENKLNHIRRKFHFCFKCKRGCANLRKLLVRVKRAQARILEVLDKMQAHKSRKHWHASRWLLKRKLSYLKSRQRTIKRRLRKCTRVCHY